ncbi:MAG: hypothetical protein LC778_16405 [Acidobacteria bacterium]|nr:hypothetical protein [Acidobacteriota bacterium]
MKTKTKTLRVFPKLCEGKPLSLPDDDAANKSMNVRAKQRLCYRRFLVYAELCGGGFAPRYLRRSMASLKI